MVISMIRRHVGHTGLQVSRLGLGTMGWGGSNISAADARDLLLTFHGAGGTLIDTAAAYGRGGAEQLLGTLLDSVVPRDDMIIATKAGFGVRDGHRVVDTSRTAMLRDLDQSLERLGTDWIDLWQVHAWGDAPIEETLAAMDYAVSSGRVRYIGVSNFVGWQTAYASAWQRAIPQRTPLASAQVEYSLLARRAEMEVLPAVRGLGAGFFPWSPLGRGVLSGKYRHGTPRDSRGASDHFSWFVEPYLDNRYRGVVEAVARAAEGMELQPAQVALLWTRDSPGVTAPLLGARTVEQLTSCLQTEELTLPPEITAALDDVSGGPVQGRP